MSDKKNTQDDEIDLIQLFQYLKNGFINLFVSIFILLLKTLILLRNDLIRNYKILVIAGIIGGGLGLSYYVITKPYFVTAAVINSPYLGDYFFKNEIDNLAIYCRENNTLALSRTLNLPAKDVKSIKDIEIEIIIDNKYISTNKDSLLYITDVNHTNFLITVSLFQKGINTRKIQDGINYMFGNNKYLSEQYNISRNAIIQEKKNLLNEIAKLDILKNLINKQISSQNPSLNSNLTVSLKQKEYLVNDPLKIYSQTLALNKQIIELNKELAKDKKIFFLSEFSNFQKYDGLSFTENTTYGIMIANGLTIILLMLIRLNKYLAKKEKHFKDAKSQ